MIVIISKYLSFVYYDICEDNNTYEPKANVLQYCFSAKANVLQYCFSASNTFVTTIPLVEKIVSQNHCTTLIEINDAFKYEIVFLFDGTFSDEQISTETKLREKRYKNPDTVSVKNCLKQPL